MRRARWSAPAPMATTHTVNPGAAVHSVVQVVEQPLHGAPELTAGMKLRMTQGPAADGAAHAPQVRRAGGVAALRDLEPAEHHQLGPCAVHVDVAHVPDHRGQLRARRPGRDLGDGDRTVRAAEPLHVGQRVPDAEGPQRLGTHFPDALVLRLVLVPGQHNGPLDPRLAQHLERRG